MKIDVSSVENYAQMTAEEKVAYFESLEIDNNEAEIDRLSHDLERYKNAVTKSNAEAKKYKDERNALMSEEEQKKQAHDEEIAAMQTELEGLKKENRIKDSTNWLVGDLGMDASLASAVATAIEDGDTAAFRTNLVQHQENMRKQYELNALAKQPSLTPGNTPTKEQLESAELEKILRAARV